MEYRDASLCEGEVGCAFLQQTDESLGEVRVQLRHALLGVPHDGPVAEAQHVLQRSVADYERFVVH